MGWSEPIQAAAEPQQASVPDNWRWPSSAPASSAPVESDRGNLYAQQAESSPAWPAHQYLPDYAKPQPTPSVEQAAPPRRGLFAALFGGAAAVPAVVEAAPSVPASWNWPAPAAESEYRGELHEPEPLAIHQEWQWPDALPGAAVESPQIEHYASAWDAPALPASDGGMGWDAQEAVSSDPWPAYAASPAPEETPQLSSQADIDSFIELAWATAPEIEPEPAADYDVPTLPPPVQTE